MICVEVFNIYRLVFGAFLISLAIQDIQSLGNVRLTLEPSVVTHLNESALICKYDLGKDNLYTVKWYRGSHEFYRHTPSESPQTKIFMFDGARVDASRSNATQVVLTDIDYNVSGTFICEVTSEVTGEASDSGNSSPKFHVQTDSEIMTVVQIPERPPEISVHGEPFHHDDVLQANCSSYPSRPPAELRFELNGIHVPATHPVSSRVPHVSDWSDLQLVIKLTDFYFKNADKLVLRCIAEIPPVYREVAELELENVKDPVFARVSAEENSTFCKRSPTWTIHVFIFMFILFFS